MKENNFNPMEEEITKESITEENQNGEVSSLKNKGLESKVASVKKAALQIKKPKIITLLILLTTILVIFFAMSLASQKEQGQLPQTKTFEISVPSPQASGKPTKLEIEKKIEEYTQKLEGMDNFSKTLSQPIVDLDISF